MQTQLIILLEKEIDSIVLQNYETLICLRFFFLILRIVSTHRNPSCHIVHHSLSKPKSNIRNKVLIDQSCSLK